jgi:hypothetical protein
MSEITERNPIELHATFKHGKRRSREPDEFRRPVFEPCREKAKRYVQQLQAQQLLAAMKKA